MSVGEAVVVIGIFLNVGRWVLALLSCWRGIELILVLILVVSSEHSTALGVSSTAVLIVALGNGLLLPLHMILMLCVDLGNLLLLEHLWW